MNYRLTPKILVMLLALLLASVVILRAQSVTIGPLEAIGFDYLDADLTTYQVNSFQAQWDNGAWVSLGIPTSVIVGDTQSGAKTYKVIPTFTSGNHTVAFRACNSAGCGAASAGFPFGVLSGPGSVPSNLRKILR